MVQTQEERQNEVDVVKEGKERKKGQRWLEDLYIELPSP